MKCIFERLKILILSFLIFLCFLFHLCPKKKRPKISLFLPIYNKEKYIHRCIRNIQNQTLKDIEIVAINDHSTDNSLKILNDLAKNDDRIKIINNEQNHGLLYSRAMGILNSFGEYLMNIDPDDELEDNNALKYLYKKVKISKSDIIAFNIIRKDFNEIVKCKFMNEIIQQPKLFTSIFDANNVMKDYFIWNKLIKKEVFLEAYEYFKKFIYKWKWNFHEDNIWSILVHIKFYNICHFMPR